MIQINKYILEKLVINSKFTDDSIKKYEEFGKGELSSLDVEDFVKEVFNINMTDQKIIDFYYNLKGYRIDPDVIFYYISNENVDKKLATKFAVLKSKESMMSSYYINIGDSKKPELQIVFKDYPSKKLFTIVFAGYIDGKLINEYFLYYR